MARLIIATMAVFGLGSVGLVVLADDNAPQPAQVDSITFKVVKTEQGDAIQITSGDVVFVVPSFTFPGNEKAKTSKFTVEDGYITTHFDGASCGFTSLTMKLRKQPQPAR